MFPGAVGCLLAGVRAVSTLGCTERYFVALPAPLTGDHTGFPGFGIGGTLPGGVWISPLSLPVGFLLAGWAAINLVDSHVAPGAIKKWLSTDGAFWYHRNPPIRESDNV